MRIRDFLAAVYDACAQRLPGRFKKHEWRIRFSYLQVYFAGPAVHYEVWVQRRGGRIELGLHFEGEREQNERWAQVMAERALEIQAQLGPSVELEEWTESWTRLHEALPLRGRLSLDLADDVAKRLVRFIEVLQPIVEEERAGVER